ncbi:hypothetical protein JHK82_045424 [Glycine max]|nr:hypothetical protein JHK82_045424 [Glycine max]
MGNSFGCSASGERLVSAARDGDLVEAKMLLECNPCLAKYSTFGGLNSPLHFAASKGHNEIVALLLENGADVNSRNYCGQTALMQACRYGHWEVVQTLLLFRCNVVKADYLSGRTALHFAAINGHARCIRLVLADFVPSAPFEALHARIDAEGDGSNVKNKHEQSVLSKFVNKTADAGITALHMAALNGHFDCVQLLLDLNANVSAATFHYGTSMDLIECGLQSTTTSSNEVDVCAVCLERQCSVAAEGCGHELCVRCALYLCSTSNVSSETCGPPGSIPCPLCRHGIISFVKLPGSQAKENKLYVSLSLCTPCMLHPCDLDRPTVSHTPEIRRNRVASVPSEMLCPVTCTPFPSVAIPLCTCNNGPCPSFEPREAEAQGGSPLHSHASMMDQDKMDGPRLEKTSCSGMFWGRRSCSREHQCNSEINA